MANVKISNLPVEANLSNVLGLAGYNASGTIKISGADIINSVGSAINTLYTSNGTLSADRVINANNNQCNFNNVRGMQITSNGSPINGVIFDVRNIGGGSILAVGDANDNVLITGGLSGTLTFEPSSALEIRSTTQGFLKPVMTGAQVEGISTPATGLEAYATSAGAGDVTGAGWWGYDGSNWIQINSAPSGPTNSLTPSNTTDLDMFNDGVVRLWWDVSASDIELEITNQGGGSGSTSSVYHASYTNFDGTSTTTSTTDFNAQNATTTGTLDFNFSTDEVMILRLWTPDASLQPGFGYYEVTFTKSSSLYTGVPILCSVRKSSF